MTKSNAALVCALEKGYRVDDKGNVFNKNGDPMRLHLKGQELKSRYHRFTIAFESSRAGILVHRLVAYQKYGRAMFDAECVRHLNGNSLDNSIDNIAIGSQKENQHDRGKKALLEHAIRTSHFIMRDDWDAINEDRAKGMSYGELGRKYGVGKGTLSYHFNKSLRTSKEKDCSLV